MNKREVSKTLTKSSRDDVIALGKLVSSSHDIVTVKKPAKTLIMLKMRESVADSEFYLGELLACEAMVKIGDKTGFAITSGDDYEKVFAMAVIDAAMNANVEETERLSEKLADMDKRVTQCERTESGRIQKSRVDFRVMEDIE